MKKNQTVNVIGTVTLVTLFAKLLGIVRESLQARAFGTQAAADLWLATTKAPRDYSQARFSPDCWLFFGKETAGLPPDFREQYRHRCVRIPMAGEARSLNLANSAAILIYEALRQNGFPGLLGTGEMARSTS